MTDDWRQFPLSGHLFFCRQLHVLLWVVLSSMSSVCWNEYVYKSLGLREWLEIGLCGFKQSPLAHAYSVWPLKESAPQSKLSF